MNNYIPLAIYFHNPDKKLLEKIILWLMNKKFKFLTLAEFLSIVQNKKKIKGGIFVSFDDGYEENIDNVLPVLNKYNIPAVFFIPSNSIEEGFFWWDIYRNSSYKSSKKAKDLWIVPNSERVKIISEIKKYNSSLPRRAISLNSLKKLSSNPLIYIGNHTNDHVICINCDNKELSKEIKLCEEKLVKWVGDKYINILSYPNGDYDNRVISIVKDNGILAAFTTESKLINGKINNYSIPRMGIVDNLSFSENVLHAIGIWQPIIGIVKGILQKAI